MSEPGEPRRTRGLVWASIVGAVVGATVGAILAVNVAIFLGPDQGYESSIADLFDANPIVGVLTVLVLAGGPVIGVVVARRSASKRP